MSIKENLNEIRKHIPDNVKLVCVSKFHPAEDIEEAYNCNERIFGESRVQELTQKQPILPKDIHWHFIGHLQSNKIKYIVDYVELIHGVDSFKLLKEVDKQAKKSGKKIHCLLQMHIAKEESKFGFSEEELKEMIASDEFKNLENVVIAGLMGMATFTENEAQIHNEFKGLRNLFDELKQNQFADNKHFIELSMGMSDDYGIAIEEGSTMVRIGTSIFGKRN